MRRIFTAILFIIRMSSYGQTAAPIATDKPAIATDKPAARPVLRRIAAKPKPKPAALVEQLPTRQPDARIELLAPAFDEPTLQAIRLSDQWKRESAMPVRGKYGSVLYTYGAGTPVLVCAPLRVCFLELQPGEQLVGDLHIGDSVRWLVSPGLYGGEQENTQVIVIKPQDPDLETNMILTTNRRAYNLRLISRPGDYIARVAFRYPEDEAKAWQTKMASTLPPAPSESKVLPAIISAESLNFGYRVKGGKDYMRPVRVFDDKNKTYFVMPRDMAAREAPALMVIGDDGKGIMSNYRVIPESNTYVLDRLIDRAQFVIGNGRKAQRVTIIRGAGL